MARRRTRWVLLILLSLGVPYGLYRLLDRATEVQQGGEPDELVPLSLALIVLTLIGWIPILGWIVALGTVVLGFGALGLQLHRLARG